MSSPRERVARMPRASTTSYGQVIEVSTITRPKQCDTGPVLTQCNVVHPGPPLPSIIHACARCDHPVPVPEAKPVAHKAVVKSASGPYCCRAEGASSGLLQHRQDPAVQRLPRRLRPTAHWSPLPICCSAARGVGRPRERGQGSCLLEQCRFKE